MTTHQSCSKILCYCPLLEQAYGYTVAPLYPEIVSQVKRLSVTNLSSENNLPMFQLNAIVTIRAHTSELKLVMDNFLFIYAAANWEDTESSLASTTMVPIRIKYQHIRLIQEVVWFTDFATKMLRRQPALSESYPFKSYYHKCTC